MFESGDDGRALEVPYPLCTSIVDGIDGAVPHIVQRANSAVVTKAPRIVLGACQSARPAPRAPALVRGTTFNADYRVESGDDDQYAMVTTFARRDGKIHHFWSSETWFVPPEPGQNPRHVDFLWPLWAVLDRTPDGRATDWWPQLVYAA